MPIAEAFMMNVLPIHENPETNDNSPDSSDIELDILHKLIPTISSIQMIAELIENKALGPLKLGVYEQYINDLKECARVQQEFTEDLIAHLRKSNPDHL